MKKILIPIVTLAFLNPPGVQAHLHVPEDAVRTFQAEWNQHDPDGMAARWTEEGDLIYPYASRFIGRNNVLALLKQEHEPKGRMSDSKYELYEICTRNLTGDIAIVDAKARITGMRREPPEQSHWVTVVLTRTKKGATSEGDEWSFVAFRMILPGPTPPAAKKE